MSLLETSLYSKETSACGVADNNTAIAKKGFE